MMNVRQMEGAEAEAYLQESAVRIGQWGQLEFRNQDCLATSGPFQAHRDSLSLFNFSQHVAGWLSKDNRLLLKFDHSNFLKISDASLIGQLCFGFYEEGKLKQDSLVLFEFEASASALSKPHLLIANLIFAIAMLEGHAQLVSPSEEGSRLLSIQDGFAYFISNAEGVEIAEQIMKGYFALPLNSAEWVNCIDNEEE